MIPQIRIFLQTNVNNKYYIVISAIIYYIILKYYITYIILLFIYIILY